MTTTDEHFIAAIAGIRNPHLPENAPKVAKAVGAYIIANGLNVDQTHWLTSYALGFISAGTDR